MPLPGLPFARTCPHSRTAVGADLVRQQRPRLMVGPPTSQQILKAQGTAATTTYAEGCRDGRYYSCCADVDAIKPASVDRLERAPGATAVRFGLADWPELVDRQLRRLYATPLLPQRPTQHDACAAGQRTVPRGTDVPAVLVDLPGARADARQPEHGQAFVSAATTSPDGHHGLSGPPQRMAGPPDRDQATVLRRTSHTATGP